VSRKLLRQSGSARQSLLLGTRLLKGEMPQRAHNVDCTGHLASSRGCARGSASHTSNLASANHESGEDRGQCHVSPGWNVSTSSPCSL